MASGSGLQTHFKTPATHPTNAHDKTSTAVTGVNQKKPSQKSSGVKSRNSRHLRTTDPASHHSVGSHDVYLGSYAHAAARNSGDAGAQRATPTSSARTSISHLQLEHLLPAVDADLETYGVEELRDGFFDASFYRPLKQNHDDLMQRASLSLSDPFKHKNHPLSLRRFFPQQLYDARRFFYQISTSRAGLKLLKSFLGFLITYIICLIPAARDWLGGYNYIMIISAIVNHPGRSIGSQIDGAALTIIGTVAGLGWGSLALYVSTSTPTAQSGYGGVLATFLVIFAALIGWLRCVFIRFYQAVLSAGIAICYTCLANTSQHVGWRKILEYGVPWILGQAVCLSVSATIFPDAGSRSLA